jgi:hypothetical protein
LFWMKISEMRGLMMLMLEMNISLPWGIEAILIPSSLYPQLHRLQGLSRT